MKTAPLVSVGLMLALSGVAHAQSAEMVRLADLSECAVFWRKTEALRYIDSERVKWTGKGPCAGGMAEGLWTLRRESNLVIGGNEIKPNGWTEVQAYFHAGRPFGWIRTTEVKEDVDISAVDLIGENRKPISWVRQLPTVRLVGEGPELAFSDVVWGIRYNAEDLAQRQWPDFSGRFSPLSLKGQGRGAIISASPEGGAIFGKTKCAAETGMFPQCGFGEGKPNFDIYYLFRATPGAARGERSFCPDPQQFASCAALGEAMAASVRGRAQATADQVRDAIKARFQQMDEVLKLAASAGRGAAPATAPAPGRSLETLPVGALYAAADEALQRGDKAAAKDALRALLRRFPDHPLAIVAAQQLGQL